MPFSRASLPINRCGETDPVVLVPALVALRLRVEQGLRPIARGETRARFDACLPRNRRRLREFAAEARLSRTGLRDLDDHRIEALVRDAIEAGSVLGMRTAAATALVSPTAGRRRLVRDIEARSHGRLAHGGRIYKLVTDADLAMVGDRDSYEVVGRASAQEILRALASEPACDAQLAALLAAAGAQLTADWRPPVGAPDGLVLLRRARSAPAAVRPTAVITPSQLKALAASDWIEIEFVDAAGDPVAVVCRLELPDATIVETNDDADGLVARRSFAPGMCRLSLPGVDGAGWRHAA